MKLAQTLIALTVLAVTGTGAEAQQPNLPFYGANLPWRAGLSGVPDIPAPIPVPAARPIPEGFSYYLRLDFTYGMNAGDLSFSEAGRNYGAGATAGSAFTSAPSFRFAGPQFSSVANKTEDTFSGGLGFGAYFTPMLRGDFTLEFRGARTTTVDGQYSYTSVNTGGPITGVMQDKFKVQSTLALMNAYVDLLPRGGFSPYLGAGIGFAYNQIDRSYMDSEFGNGTGQFVSGRATGNSVTFAAALMAGATVAFDHRWAIDFNYRALYMQGVDASINTVGLTNAQLSQAHLGDNWEHQVRVGLRFNIW